jgi:phosphate-selective porin OprO/OprP
VTVDLYMSSVTWNFRVRSASHAKRNGLWALLVLLLPMCLTGPVAAQVIDPQNIVIKNVYIATEDAEALPVNLLIRDNKLELISEDDIPLTDGMVALNADGGYLLGNLILGESANFIILDADPRTDMEVLLDTKAHSVFAVHNGKLRKNSLLYTSETHAEKSHHAGWHAYMPPPVALPTHYGDSAPWNHWTTRYTTGVFFAVLAVDRQYWLSQNNDSEQQVGNLEDYEGGEVRDLRLGLLGTLKYFERPWTYNVVVATNAFNRDFALEDQNSFKALDYRLDIPFGKSVKLSLGKQKEPISMERIMTLINLPMQERSSVADAFLPSRNFGTLLSGNALGRRMSWAGGIFNTFIDSHESIDDAATSVVGRVTWLPLVSEDESNLLHLGFAAKLSDGNQGYLYRAEPEFSKSPLFIDTGPGDADDIRQYAFEASWRRGSFWLGAEYVATDVNSPTNGNLDFSGYHVTASWILTGEMRNYNYNSGTFGPVPISRSVYQNGKGAWEVATRWSSTDLDDGPVEGGTMDVLSLAASWWLSPIFNVSFNYRHVMDDRDNLHGEASGAAIRILLKLE